MNKIGDNVRALGRNSNQSTNIVSILLFDSFAIFLNFRHSEIKSGIVAKNRFHIKKRYQKDCVNFIRIKSNAIQKRINVK